LFLFTKVIKEVKFFLGTFFYIIIKVILKKL
jgi:hypothetical protein